MADVLVLLSNAAFRSRPVYSTSPAIPPGLRAGSGVSGGGRGQDADAHTQRVRWLHWSKELTRDLLSHLKCMTCIMIITGELFIKSKNNS